MKVDRWLKNREAYADDLAQIRDERFEKTGNTPPPRSQGVASGSPGFGHGAAWIAVIVVSILGLMVGGGVLIASLFVTRAQNVPPVITPTAAHVQPPVAIPANVPPAPAPQVASVGGYRGFDLVPVTEAAQALGGDALVRSFSEMPVSRGRSSMRVDRDGERITIKAGSGVTMPPVRGAGDLAFISGGMNSHELTAVDMATGRVAWSVQLADNGPSPVSVDAGTAVVNTESCTLYALNADNGDPKWSYYVSHTVLAQLGVGEGVVVTTYPSQAFATRSLPVDQAGVDYRPSHVIAAFNADNGVLLWQRIVDGDSYGPPIVRDNRVYLATHAGTRYIFSADHGDVHSAIRDGVSSQPAIDDEAIYFTAAVQGGEALCAAPRLEPDVVELLHVHPSSNHLAGPPNPAGNQAVAAPGAGAASTVVGGLDMVAFQNFEGSRPAVGHGRVAAVLGDQLVCLPKPTFSRLPEDSMSPRPTHGKASGWEHALTLNGQRWGAAPPAFHGDRLVVGASTGELLTFNADDGALLASQRVTSAPIASVHVDTGRALITTHGDRAIVLPLTPPASASAEAPIEPDA